jgi:4-amino-4-deoxy-L-arabinose transferase-like glycosyltransferase
MGMMDVMLTFFITLMVYLFWVGQEKPSYLFWSGISLLFAYMAKGMAAVSGPAIIILYCLFSGNLKLLTKRKFVVGIVVSLAFIAAWHTVQYIYCGSIAIDSYFGFHLFKRATQALEGHTGGINFYQKVIFNKNKPWGVLYYPSVAYIIWLAVTQKEKRAMLLSIWAVVVFAICTAVRTKLHWYVMPVYPALAIASAIALEKLFRERTFYIILSAVLFGMLIQVPVSWAFKLDFNARAKAAGINSEKLPYEDNGSIFYHETVKIRARN